VSRETVDTGTQEVLCCVENAVAVITLNRPKARNALSPALKDGLSNALVMLADDPRVGCLVLTGAGGAFCAGGDVKRMGQRTKSSPDSLDTYKAGLEKDQLQLSGALHRFPRPTIAALPGAAAGAGLALALACDMRIAAECSFVSTAYAKVGLSGDYGMSWLLPRLVGPAKAAELIFGAPRVSASECERIGLVNRVVPDEALLPETMALAQQFANGPKVALTFMKKNLAQGETLSLDQSMSLEADRMVRCMVTEDHREAAQAFVEKRPPKFKGR